MTEFSLWHCFCSVRPNWVTSTHQIIWYCNLMISSPFLPSFWEFVLSFEIQIAKERYTVHGVCICCLWECIAKFTIERQDISYLICAMLRVGIVALELREWNEIALRNWRNTVFSSTCVCLCTVYKIINKKWKFSLCVSVVYFLLAINTEKTREEINAAYRRMARFKCDRLYNVCICVLCISNGTCFTYNLCNVCACACVQTLWFVFPCTCSLLYCFSLGFLRWHPTAKATTTIIRFCVYTGDTY